MPEFSLDTLDNGLRVVTVAMPHLHSAELVAYVGCGGRHEPPGEAGTAHFLEHMVFRGTDDYDNSVALERAFEAIGGAINASTDMETTSFFSRLHPRHLDRGVELLASMLRHPLLREADVETERKIIREEALEDLNEQGEEINPDTLSAALFWPDHPLGQPVIGTRESMDAISAASLRRFHATFYTPANTVLVATGRLQREQVVAAARQWLGDWQGPAPEQPPAAPPRFDQGPRFHWVEDSSSQLAVSLNFYLPGRHHPDTAAVRVLRRILGWGGGSRLMTRLREELGLMYAVDAELLQYDDCGTLSIDFAVAQENLRPAMKALLQLLEEVCSTPVLPEEQETAVQSYRYDLEFSRDLPDEMAVRFGWGTLAGCCRTLEEDRQRIEQVTKGDLQRVARDVFRKTAAALVVVGPWQKNDRKDVETMVQAFQGGAA